MNNPSRSTVLVVAIVVGLVAVGVAAGVPSESVLVVEDVETGEVYLSEPVDDGSIVALEYMHSVEKSRVYDEYRIDGTTLVNTRMEFESYGWGLPARVDVENINGTLVYEPDEPIAELETLSVSPGRIAGHTLIIDAHRHDLVDATNASDVRLYVDRQSVIDQLP